MSEPLSPVLVVMALPAESQGKFEQARAPLLYTGLGKVNAALSLARRLGEYRSAGQALPLVVNFGSAGSRRFATGSLVACERFAQRDMDVTGLGFERGVTPFEDIPAVLEFPAVFPGLPRGLCGTGDSFETGSTAHYDIIDMEAYALAKVCWMERTQFACAKFVTDGADPEAGADWQANLPRAATAFMELYSRLPGSSEASADSVLSIARNTARTHPKEGSAS